MDNTAMRIPAVALRGMTILPGMIAHFDISRPRSIMAVERAMGENQEIFLVTQKDTEQELPTVNDLFAIGIFAEVRQVIKLQKDIVRVLVEGKKRAKLVAFTDEQEYLEAEIAFLDADVEEGLIPEAKEAMVISIRENFERYAKVNGKMGQDVLRQVQSMTDLESLMDYVSNNLPVHYEEKQKILEAETLTERYEALLTLLFQEIEVNGIKQEFQKKVRERVDKHQKEYILREQMGLIREELGENSESEADEYEKALQKLKAPKEVKERIRKEIDHFRQVSGSSSESAVTRGYIETLLELPWNRKSKDNKDIDHAQRVLDDEHYGLSDVKKRVIEFLAVRNLTGKGDSPIVCLVGPPGTGKTSIARSVARALNKEYVRICLGGVRDEAEIRGHRKTYVGAMPGRIINGLRSAGVSNPLMLLDEIDKVSSDYKGDTSAALLEVLDSEQNSKFRDHYVELPVDLSDVLFLATANSVQDIPKPLLDRMEIIEINSYTENEKFHIAREHLIAKQMEKNGLVQGQITISDSALRNIITSYTKEAGVRGLERKIGEICRKVAADIYRGKMKSARVTAQNLEKYLGREKYRKDIREKEPQVGLVCGLAWTSVGGVTLDVEVSVMPGKGEFRLTGKMGDVMKESAQAAVSYVRSVSGQYGIKPDYFQKHDIHIHIPEGAVPKDGPSAGITMATAILSAVCGRKVRADVAMTGEVTLRGRVLPIGGLKEKLLAAKNSDIHTVCIPMENERDLEDISKEILEGLTIMPVEKMEQVLEVALV